VALTPGTKIGSYEVASQLGVGGMGEVYRATDTNLKRQVAIKVLPEAVAADTERLARFQREAEVLAALNHPNIAAIYGLERSPSTDAGQAGQTALVMELVEGPTLADRIAQGPVPVDEALAIAKQIAEALEAAHEQGIIHSVNDQELSSGVAQYDVARDGTLVYLPGTTPAGGAAFQLALVDEAGTVTVLPAPPRDYAVPRVSPDGAQIAVEVTEAGFGDGVTHVFVVSGESGVLRQLTFDGTRNRWPIWTADGSAVVFESGALGRSGRPIRRPSISVVRGRPTAPPSGALPSRPAPRRRGVQSSACSGGCRRPSASETARSSCRMVGTS